MSTSSNLAWSTAVTSAEVRNGSLLRRGFRQGTLPRGAENAEHLAAGEPGRTFWLD
jgi:hypothetical protein